MKKSVHWLEYPENNTIDPRDGGEALCYGWDGMQPPDAKKLVKQAYERGLECGNKKIINVLLECYDRAEDVDEYIQEFFPELEQVVNNEIHDAMNKVLRAADHIQNIIRIALGGVEALIKARDKRNKTSNSEND